MAAAAHLSEQKVPNGAINTERIRQQSVRMKNACPVGGAETRTKLIHTTEHLKVTSNSTMQLTKKNKNNKKIIQQNNETLINFINTN